MKIKGFSQDQADAADELVRLGYATRERGVELGFVPCIDCHDGFCTMNCSSAPGIMKVWP